MTALFAQRGRCSSSASNVIYQSPLTYPVRVSQEIIQTSCGSPMACTIVFKKSVVWLNNMQFSRLIALALQAARRSSSADEHKFVERMGQMESEEFWSGRGIDISADFPSVEERKFWARVFLDTARLVFDREVGKHEHHFWQAQTIHQAYGVGLLFQNAARQDDPDWRANTVDTREFDQLMNGPKRKDA